MIKTLVNGIASDSISVTDRGFLYGHGLFETIAIQNAQPLLLEQHLQRLEADAKRLGFTVPIDSIKEDVISLSETVAQGVVRITSTCGSGGRGYATPKDVEVNRVVSLFDWPEHIHKLRSSGIQLGLSDHHISSQPILAGIKHLNRLEQIIIRQHWQNDWQEAIVCDEQGHIIEATQSNVFIVSPGGQLITPKLNKCGINGVMRNTVMQYAAKIGLEVSEQTILADQLLEASELFVTNSIIGIWPVNRFKNKQYNNKQIAQNLIEELIKNDAITKS